MKDTDPVFGPNDHPARVMTAEEVRSLMGYDNDIVDLIEKGYCFAFYDTEGVLRIGLTRRGFAASKPKPVRS